MGERWLHGDLKHTVSATHPRTSAMSIVSRYRRRLCFADHTKKTQRLVKDSATSWAVLVHNQTDFVDFEKQSDITINAVLSLFVSTRGTRIYMLTHSCGFVAGKNLRFVERFRRLTVHEHKKCNFVQRLRRRHSTRSSINVGVDSKTFFLPGCPAICISCPR